MSFFGARWPLALDRDWLVRLMLHRARLGHPGVTSHDQAGLPGLGIFRRCAKRRQAMGGHLRVMQSARPVADVLIDPLTPPALGERLRLAQSIRQFAIAELHLPDNASYQGYADLQRPYVVWNVVAAPEFSLTLKTWCFPVAGCVGLPRVL